MEPLRISSSNVLLLHLRKHIGYSGGQIWRFRAIKPTFLPGRVENTKNKTNPPNNRQRYINRAVNEKRAAKKP